MHWWDIFVCVCVCLPTRFHLQLILRIKGERNRERSVCQHSRRFISFWNRLESTYLMKGSSHVCIFPYTKLDDILCFIMVSLSNYLLLPNTSIQRMREVPLETRLSSLLRTQLNRHSRAVLTSDKRLMGKFFHHPMSLLIVLVSKLKVTCNTFYLS